MASRRMGRAARSAGWVFVLLAICAVPVLATSGVLSDWSSYYPDSTLDTTYDCQLCHSGGSMNPYGASVRDAWTGAVQEAFASAESQDPDGDGYTSGVEIAANTHPGDASSHPTGDSDPPSAPSGLNATAVSSMRIDLSWTASTDNVGVDHYNVYRDDALVAQPTGTSYVDMPLSPGKLYQYHVTAEDAASNESGPSNAASATTLAMPLCDSELISAGFPAHMIKDDTAAVTIAMRNMGSTTWTTAGGFALGAQTPADNTTWGMGRVSLGGDSIANGADKTFDFIITAPHEVGLYSCDWQMVQDGGYGWFGPMAGDDIEVISFDDVRMDHWAWEQVEGVCAAGIVTGYADGLYRPDFAVTRDQMAVYISRALAGGDENVPEFTGVPAFPDVPGGFWALDYVEYAVSQNVVGGYEDGTYHPEYQVTRDQMAVYVARALIAPGGEAGLADYVPADPRNFPDVASDFWSYKHVEYCVENGVVAGYLDGLYHPEIVVTRDQMAVYVARAFGLTS